METQMARKNPKDLNNDGVVSPQEELSYLMNNPSSARPQTNTTVPDNYTTIGTTRGYTHTGVQ